MYKKTLLSLVIIGASVTTVTFASSAQATDIKQGGTLTVPIINSGFVENFNPYTGGDLTHGTIFEPLMVFNTMTGEVEYRLAESVQYSDDLKTVTLKIRKGLEWSDGKPLTSKDVVYSYEMTKQTPAFDVKGFWSTGKLNSVTATDTTTIVFKSTDHCAVIGL